MNVLNKDVPMHKLYRDGAVGSTGMRAGASGPKDLKASYPCICIVPQDQQQTGLAVGRVGHRKKGCVPPTELEAHEACHF